MSHPLAGVLGAPQVKPAFFVQLVFVVFQQYLAEAVDGPQGGAQVVRNRVAEGLQLVVEGLELGGAPPDASLQLFVEPAEIFLGALALGDVADHHADDLPTSVADHVRADLHLDQGAILAKVAPLTADVTARLQYTLYVAVHILPGVGDELVERET